MMEPGRTPTRENFVSDGGDHRYSGALESPPGYWFVRCDCGWGMRSLSSREQAMSEYDRHERGLEWWE